MRQSSLRGPRLSFRVILGLYWDYGKENGNYYSIIGYILGLYWGLGFLHAIQAVGETWGCISIPARTVHLVPGLHPETVSPKP